ncbi:sigma 54-interacting transcriptional regulator [Myxococcaceae bacterium JPH2]|nr:sigma 54-interacting transcriptional regulator [Myxococcaceae bacterium JPH2]
MARLVAMFGPCRGVARRLDAALVIGRACEGGWRLRDEQVSREHCAIEPNGSGHTLRDLDSSHGTWLNGQRIQAPARLRPGDQVSVGESILVYEPTFDALRASDGESTVVLTRTKATPLQRARAPGPEVLARAGELALRIARPGTPDALADMVFEALESALQPTALVLLRFSPRGPRPHQTWPTGAHLTVSRELVGGVLKEGCALAMTEPQFRAEPEARHARLAQRAAHVLCAPMYAGGAPVGVLCAVRDEPFQAEELALAGALAGVAGPAFSSLAPPTPVAPSPPLVANSPALREVLRAVDAAARAHTPVLLSGERGTGKQSLARALHAQGSRASGPYVVLRCGADTSENMLLDALTQAEGGTLLVGDVPALPAPLQEQLARVLREQVLHHASARVSTPVDVRVVATIREPAREAVRAGTLREDLHQGLADTVLNVPPLRERPEDVLPLAEHFLSLLAPALGHTPRGFTDEARAALRACAWPGNARQLANVIERALLLMPVASVPVGERDLFPDAPVRERSLAPKGEARGTLSSPPATAP